MNLLKWLAGIVVTAWLGQYLLAMALPNMIMELLHRQGGKERGVNQLVLTPPPDENAREVVRPSPDLLYAICIYDLSDGPLLIEAPVPPRYWSMQFYQMNTDNFAGFSNQRSDAYRVGSTLKVLLLGPGQEPGIVDGELVRSPTQRGVMLLRASAIGEQYPQLTALKASTCRPV